jgi:hypothetical protein
MEGTVYNGATTGSPMTFLTPAENDSSAKFVADLAGLDEPVANRIAAVMLYKGMVPSTGGLYALIVAALVRSGMLCAGLGDSFNAWSQMEHLQRDLHVNQALSVVNYGPFLAGRPGLQTLDFCFIVGGPTRASGSDHHFRICESTTWAELESAFAKLYHIETYVKENHTYTRLVPRSGLMRSYMEASPTSWPASMRSKLTPLGLKQNLAVMQTIFQDYSLGLTLSVLPSLAYCTLKRLLTPKVGRPDEWKWVQDGLGVVLRIHQAGPNLQSGTCCTQCTQTLCKR